MIFPQRFVTLLFMALGVALPTAAPALAADEPVDFSREIRPILAGACFYCHGPDEAQRKADMRLDTKEGMLGHKAGDAPVVVPGKPAASNLYQRIISQDADEHMPPADSGKKLSDQQIELIRRWIAQGAKWNTHWAFVPPVRPALPKVTKADWVRNPIDAFVLARLEREHLQPSPEADRVTLLRRLSLDLIGLPPTPEEVAAFVKNDAPDAYEHEVERLLASPHYGERWGRTWLDAARYADSDGYEKDKPRQVWAYRDWVVSALNHDLPYDQFVIDQIAGDLLPHPTQEQRVATGFLRNSMINEEGGIDPEQFRMEAMFDRMDAIGKGVLGLTIQCAQCHNHKYDPLTQEEYYRMFAYLNSDHAAIIPVYSPEQLMKVAEIRRSIHEIEAGLQHRNESWRKEMAAWEDSVRGNQPKWTVIHPEVDEATTAGEKFLPRPDGSLIGQGYSPVKERVKFTAKTDVKNVTAVRLELLTDPELPMGGPGRSTKGMGLLTEFEVETSSADAADKPTKNKIAKATADINLPEAPLDSQFADKEKMARLTGPIDFAIDDKKATAWNIDCGPGRRNQPRKAVFNFETPIANPAGTELAFYLAQQHGGWNSNDNQSCNLGRFRLSVTNEPDVVADPLPKKVRDLLAVPAERRTPAQTAAMFSYYRTTVSRWKEANDQIEALWREYPEGATQLVLSAFDKPRETHILERGDFLKPTRAVGPGVPAFLNPLPPDAPPNRLTFARWLVDRQSPTTARSIVNRVWQNYFGIGLVSTAEDLGSQAESPSHPELLDFLAVELMDRGWRIKSLQRLIVNSATYRQASRVTPEVYAQDPYNRLLARGARVRVDAEVIHDIALSASGLLNPKVGGPSVCPPAPAFLFVPPASYGYKVWSEATGDERYRRSLYTFRFRSVPYPALQVFDAPNGDFSCVRRARSNTPLQALTTLNEPGFLECARALALRTLNDGGDDDRQRLMFAFRRCLARAPGEKEIDTLTALYQKQLAHFGEPDAKPWELAADDPEHPPQLPAKATPAQAAAWTAVARVLLNLDETITKQ